MKLSVPHIVPKAHFTHEVRFTCDAYFTFRESETLSSKNAPLSVDKSAFFVGGGSYQLLHGICFFVVVPLFDIRKAGCAV